MLFVENRKTLIDKTLSALKAKPDHRIELTKSWRQALQKRLNKVVDPNMLLTEFLKYAKIRPLTHEILVNLYKITLTKCVYCI